MVGNSVNSKAGSRQKNTHTHSHAERAQLTAAAAATVGVGSSFVVGGVGGGVKNFVGHFGRAQPKNAYNKSKAKMN